MGKNGLCHIYGYARVSTREQAISPTVQAERIEAKATELAVSGELEFACCCTDDGFSANKVAFEDRPGYSELLREMQRGDHLIVWRLDRIDRNPFRLIRAVEQLISRNITIHSLEEKGGLALDLDTVQGRAMVMIWAIMADLFTQQLSESIRSAIAWRKANGLVYYGQPSYGRKRIRLPKKPGERKGRLVDVWDKKEMAQIREIKRRHDEGETIQSIGADFYHRNETTANNKPWIKRYTKGVSRTRGHLNVQRLYRVLHWYKTAPPKAKTWARPQPQAAQTQTLLRPHPLPHDPSPPLWTVHHGSPPCTWGQCLKPLKRDRAP